MNVIGIDVSEDYVHLAMCFWPLMTAKLSHCMRCFQIIHSTCAGSNADNSWTLSSAIRK
jgi:hypothetical protein